MLFWLLYCQTVRSSFTSLRQMTDSKCGVNVDLTKGGCDKVLSVQVPKHDLKDDESWNNSWEDLCGEIGNELKDDTWESKCDLFDTKTNTAIQTLNDFVNVFKNALNSGEPVLFYVGVKLILYHLKLFVALIVFFCFFLVCFCAG